MPHDEDQIVVFLSTPGTLCQILSASLQHSDQSVNESLGGLDLSTVPSALEYHIPPSAFSFPHDSHKSPISVNPSLEHVLVSRLSLMRASLSRLEAFRPPTATPLCPAILLQFFPCVEYRRHGTQ